MQTDHVEINLNQEKKPLKEKPERIEKTICCNFTLTPTMNPSISDLVNKLSWDSVNNLLKIDIKENREFDAFRWFGSINERHQATQKSSFVDFDKDALILTFYSAADDELAKMQFRNLKLMSHTVDFSERTTNMLHVITINYQDCQLFVQERGDLDDWKEIS